MQAIRFPQDSPIRLLPLVYFLPFDTLIKCPTLCKLPRCFSELAHSPEHIATLQSDQFFNEVITATARMVFPHFGLRGWLEHYSGYCPAWKLAHAAHAWAKALDDEIGFGVQWLFNQPKGAVIPFFDDDYIRAVMQLVAKRGITEQNWQPILNAVKEMPCHEDFEPFKSNIRKDFHRKWYHTRAKVKILSLEECLEDENNPVYDIPDNQPDIATQVAAEDYWQRFKTRLTPKDLQILELRAEGRTYEDIARRLGYKNHSGVLKRIRAITAEYEKYENEQQ